jgi:hypothetical protein
MLYAKYSIRNVGVRNTSAKEGRMRAKKGLRWGRNGAIAGFVIGVIMSVSNHPQYWHFSALSSDVIAYLIGNIFGPAMFLFVVGFLMGLIF